MIKTAVTHYRTIFMAFILLLIAGSYSYIAIPKEAAPDVTIPMIYVNVNHDGISPEDAVKLLLKPLEQEMRGLDGLDEMEGMAYEGGANLVLHFEAGFDNTKALADVRDNIDKATAEFPEEADDPVIKEINVSLFPVLTIILAGDLPDRELKKIVEDLQDEIESLPGVLEATKGGVRDEQLLIEINKNKLESFAIDPQNLVANITNNNKLIAAGSLEMDRGKYAIKVPGLFKNSEDVLNLIIFSDNNKTIRIKDVGTVKLNFKDPVTITRVDGKPAVTLSVSKRIGENIIETVDTIKTIVAKSSEAWPASLKYSFVSDQSVKTRTQLSDLENNVIIAVILVMVVILAALGVRSSFLVAITIPGAFLTAIMILFALGFTTNTVVLFGLILSVGLLVDGAIVVTELADNYLRMGKKRVEAFTLAAQEMSWPIIASTATTLAAFMPLLFWPGIVGQFMKFMPITLIFTLTASLLMALIFLPTIGAAMPRPPYNKKDSDIIPFYVPIYEKIMLWALAKPIKVITSVVIMFIGTIALYSMAGTGIEFFPSIEPARAQLVVKSAGDLSISEKNIILKEAEKRISNIEGIATVYATAGDATAQQNGPSDTIGTILLEYVPWEDGRRRSAELLNIVAEKTDDIYGVTIERQKQAEGPVKGKPIKIVITAPVFEILKPIVDEIVAKLEALPATINVDSNLPESGIEWDLEIDRNEATRSGTNLSAIGSNIRLATNGIKVGKYRPETSNDEIDIIARFTNNSRTLSSIDDITIYTPTGRVPLSHFAKRVPKPKVNVVRRLDQKPAAYIEADVIEGYLAQDIVKAMEKELAKINLPQGVKIKFEGENKEQKEAGAFLGKAFVVAIFIMAIILVTQFNSFYQAFIILSAVILSITGVLLGHMIMGNPFGIIMSGLGIIALAGIVVNNNIVLIDTFNHLLPTMPWKQAIIETGKRRLRPVLLTAITTIVGLAPMAFKLNIDIIGRHMSYNAPSTQWWNQLSSSIIFGLAFATILTLVVTPCMLALAYRKR